MPNDVARRTALTVVLAAACAALLLWPTVGADATEAIVSFPILLSTPIPRTALVRSGRHELRLTGKAARTIGSSDDIADERLGEYRQEAVALVAVIDVHGDAIVSVSLRLAPPTPGPAFFALPPMRVHFGDLATGVPLSDPIDLRPVATERAISVAVPAAFGHIPTMPSAVFLQVEVQRMDITTYRFDLNGISRQLASGALFDLNPANASMGFKFLASVSAKGDLGLWALRKPPMPDFTLLWGVDGDFVEGISFAGVRPQGMGVDDALSVVDVANRTISVVAHFYERPREQRATAVLSAGDSAAIAGALTSDGHNEFVDRRRHSIGTDTPQLRFVLQYFNDTKHIAVTFTQPHAVERVQLSVYTRDGRLTFREEEDHVPFIESDAATQFGWYYAIPTRPEGPQDVGSTKSFLDNIGRIELAYNRRAQAHPAETLRRWLGDYGGSVDKIRLATDDPSAVFVRGAASARQPLRDRGIVLDADRAAAGELLFSIPYRLVLTEEILVANPTAREILNKSGPLYHQAALDHRTDPAGLWHMLATVFGILLPSHPRDAINWRLYFDAVPTEAPAQPMFYTDAELALFDFSPPVRRDANTTRQMWRREYAMLGHTSAWLYPHASEQRYLALRGHVEQRMLQAGRRNLLIPLCDFLHHDDDPSVRAAFDDDAQTIRFLATRALRRGEALTADFTGSAQRSKRHFLMQFGFIPAGAADDAEVAFAGVDGENAANPERFVLTLQPRSVDALRAAVEASLVAKRNRSRGGGGARAPASASPSASASVSPSVSVSASLSPAGEDADAVGDENDAPTARASGIDHRAVARGVAAAIARVRAAYPSVVRPMPKAANPEAGKSGPSALEEAARRLLASELKVLDFHKRLAEVEAAAPA